MYRIKLSTTSPDIVTFLLQDFVNYQTDEKIQGMSALVIHSMFENTDMPIILKHKETKDIYTFLFLPIQEELVGLPVEIEDELFYIKYGDNKVGILEKEMDEIVEIVEEYIENLPPIKPQPFFHPVSKLDFNIGDHILIEGNKDFKVYRSRSVVPVYTLITESTAEDPDFHGQRLIVPLEVIDNSVYAFIGSGYKLPIEQYFGELPNSFDQSAYLEIIEKIRNFKNLTDSSKENFEIILEEDLSNNENN